MVRAGRAAGGKGREGAEEEGSAYKMAAAGRPGAGGADKMAAGFARDPVSGAGGGDRQEGGTEAGGRNCRLDSSLRREASCGWPGRQGWTKSRSAAMGLT